MAHYDCKDCGASMGIAFGMCDSCTPTEYKQLAIELAKLNTESEQAWRDIVYNEKQYFISSYKCSEKQHIQDQMTRIKKDAV